MNRIQLSLMISDDELYENLLLNAKQARELHQLTISLYTAYYYNDKVRELVNSGSATVSQEDNTGIADAIADMRNNLAMQTFLLNDVANTIEDGASTITEAYNNAGNVEITPGTEVQFSRNEAGNTNVKLISAGPRNFAETQDVTKVANTSDNTSDGLSKEEVELLKNLLKMLAKQPDMLSGLAKQEASTTSENLDENAEMQETSRINSGAEYSASTENVESDFEITEVEPASPFEEESTESEDASSFIDDLLGSI